MSGIAGIWWLDGRATNSSEVGRMLDTLAARGPDASGQWVCGSVGLGHAMLWTTPESLNEKLPLADPAGNLVITADARIDNRDELVADCGIAGPAGNISDSQLILAAYKKWGEKCPEKLLGDFAFVIWDPRQQELFCARDGMGLAPLYYHRSPDVFLFASEIKALLVIAEVPRAVDEMMVANYITANFIDTAATFYKDIYRLDPGHSLNVSKRGTRLRCYWALDPAREVRLANDEAYAEALREIFTRAVRCRLRSAFPVGADLSGGLDSSSVVCMAREIGLQNGGQPLHTFSALFNQTACADERRYIEAVLAGGSIQPHFLDAESLDPLCEIDLRFQELDEPFYVPALYIFRAIFELARAAGVRVVLSGDDGDNAVGYGDGRISDLSVKGHLISAVREALAFAKRSNRNRWGSVKTYVIRPLVPKSVMQLRDRAQARWGPLAVIAPGFAKRIDYNAKCAKWPATPDGEEARLRQWRALTNGTASYECEVCNKAAARLSVEPRYPFYDRRLLEFCLAVPAEQKLNNGFVRSIMRRALKGTLPELVRWRGDKADARPAIAGALRRFGQGLINGVLQAGTLNGFVDLRLLEKNYIRFLAGDSTGNSDLNVWGAVTLARWLQSAPQN